MLEKSSLKTDKKRFERTINKTRKRNGQVQTTFFVLLCCCLHCNSLIEGHSHCTEELIYCTVPSIIMTSDFLQAYWRVNMCIIFVMAKFNFLLLCDNVFCFALFCFGGSLGTRGVSDIDKIIRVSNTL